MKVIMFVQGINAPLPTDVSSANLRELGLYINTQEKDLILVGDLLVDRKRIIGIFSPSMIEVVSGVG